jgi:hypothetical protein
MAIAGEEKLHPRRIAGVVAGALVIGSALLLIDGRVLELFRRRFAIR